MMLRLIAAAVMVMVLTAALAFAQDIPADPLAFTPTGDALWDTYAQAQLELLGVPDAFIDEAGPKMPILTDATLDSWEAQFGDDPRYWQLRYWEEMRHGDWDNGGCQRALGFLEEGRLRGAFDAVNAMLLYDLNRKQLDHNWDMYAEGTLPGDSDFAPVVADGAVEYSWYVNERLRMADELVADCPDESWAFYERAMVGFEFGEWEAGFNDLEQGSLILSNRMPVPFPLSFVNERLGTTEGFGNPAIAGRVVEDNVILMMGQMNYIRIKDHMKEQEVRWLLGAPLSEAGPWYIYACRLGSMEGAYPIQWLVGHVLCNMVLNQLLVQTPEAFSVDQRQALWGLHGRGFKVRELVMSAHETDIGELTDQMDQVALARGITDLDSVDESFWLTQDGRSVMLDLTLASYRFHLDDYGRAVCKYYPKVKERFEMLATFDMETYSWPEQ